MDPHAGHGRVSENDVNAGGIGWLLCLDSRLRPDWAEG